MCLATSNRRIQRPARRGRNEYIVTDPSGIETLVGNLFAFCQANALTLTAMTAVARGRKSHHKSWECRFSSQSYNQWLQGLAAPTKRLEIIKGDKKWCRSCESYLPFDCFYSYKSTVHGLSPYCRSCSRDKGSKDYRLNRETRLAAAADYRKKNTDNTRASCRAYYRANRHKFYDANQRRRARLRANGPVESINRRHVWQRDKGICWLCRKPVDFEKMHLDHVTPVSKGGAHTHANVRTSCAHCNIGKKDRIISKEKRRAPVES